MIDDVIAQLLDDRSYHIEFNGPSTNHAKPTVIALAGLNSPVADIKAYYYAHAVRPLVGYSLEPAEPLLAAITTVNWRHHLGERTSFGSYCVFFDQQAAELGLARLLCDYVPALLPGWVGSLTHAATHLGWALDAGHRWMAIEGLAYMACSYTSWPEQEAAHHVKLHDLSPVDSLLRIADFRDRRAGGIHRWGCDIAPSREADRPVSDGFSLEERVTQTLSTGHPLLHALPAWLDRQTLAACWDQLSYAVALLYLAKPGDLVLLHLITSLHATEQIANRLPPHEQVRAIRCFWTGMLAILFSLPEAPSKAKLAALHRVFQDAIDIHVSPDWSPEWCQITARALAEEEKHNPRAVYVLRQWWDRTQGRAIFRSAASQFACNHPVPPRAGEHPAGQ
ncbi:questin oxidase family protein [Streptomyces klenkii]|uniref:questin oxidase family protein n=1 Tax=Streptomyces klenkii TaxID=1420899 RepID=UPI0034387154